jgi:hypothetical protein
LLFSRTVTNLIYLLPQATAVRSPPPLLVEATAFAAAMAVEAIAGAPPDGATPTVEQDALNTIIVEKNRHEFCLDALDEVIIDISDDESALLLPEMAKETFLTRLFKKLSFNIGWLKTFIADKVSRKFKKLKNGTQKFLGFFRNFCISARQSRLGHICSNLCDIVFYAYQAYKAVNNMLKAVKCFRQL